MLLPLFFDGDHWTLVKILLSDKTVFLGCDPLLSQQCGREARRICQWAEPNFPP